MTDPSPIVVFPDPAVTAYLVHLSWLPFTNPFVPAWAAREHAVLPAGSLHEDRAPDDAFKLISERLQRDVAAGADRIRDGGLGTAQEMAVYRGAALYALWDRYRAEIQTITDEDGVEVPFRDAFWATYKSLCLDLPALGVPGPGHLLSVMYPRGGPAPARIWRRSASDGGGTSPWTRRRRAS